MTINLLPVPSFDDVPEFETNTQVLGGPGGPANTQAQALTNRTQYLYVWQQSVGEVTGAGLFGYDGTGATVYPIGSVGDALNTLFGNLKTATGVPNQVSVTPDNTDPTVINFGLPLTCVAPGSLTVTGQLAGNGTPTNDDAAAGQIGEFQSITGTVSLAAGSPGPVTVVCQQTLGPGDWMVECQLQLSGTVTNITSVGGSTTPVAAIPDNNYLGNWLGRSGSLPATQTIPVRKRRVTVAAGNTLTIYLVVQANFATGTMNVTGFMDITRRR